MKMTIDRKEIFRYLGYGKHEVDEATKQLTETCVAELAACAEPKMVMQENMLTLGTDGEIDCGCFSTKSKNLSKNLGGCERVLLMAATLGVGVDRLLLRYGKLHITNAVVIQAAAAAMIEAYCNSLCAQWKNEYEEKGLYLRPRFSPGYGDFSLECQEKILNGLDAGKRIGITLTDGGLMMPSKSVTAVIGISRTKDMCPVYGCEACENKMCRYRR